jgi:predicted DsbA family dithiol-disulfide isomerase
MLIEIYADIVCPWCYIGERRFSRALAQREDAEAFDVVFRPFQLDPREPRGSRPLREALARKFGSRAEPMMRQVSEAARGEGITIDWDRALAANTFDAHRLLWFALRDHDAAVQRALIERLFAAHFSEGGDVGDREQLADWAAAVGIDRAQAAAFLASEDGVPEIRGAMEEAHDLGITAVPTFVLDQQYAIPGAQPPEVFAQALEQVAPTS